MIFLGHNITLVSSGILGVPPGCKNWGMWFLWLLLSQYSHSTPTQRCSFNKARSILNLCLAVSRFLDVGCCQDQQTWYFFSIPSTLQYFTGYQKTFASPVSELSASYNDKLKPNSLYCEFWCSVVFIQPYVNIKIWILHYYYDNLLLASNFC